MRRFIGGVILAISVCGGSVAEAQPARFFHGGHGGVGRHWHRGGSASFVGGRRHFFRGCGFPAYGYGLWGGWSGSYYNASAFVYPAYDYPMFGGVYGYLPNVIQPHPIILGKDPFDNPVLKKDQQLDELQKIKDALRLVGANPKPLKIKKSNGAAKQRSLHQQALGDLNFRERKFSKAYSHYRSAVRAAPDLAENYFRMAWALASMEQHLSAVQEIKRGLRVDPYWPLTGLNLDAQFGDENALSKGAMLLSAAQWVRDDIRDPDRLFLMGVMLHFNDDVDRALKFFETAGQLAGSPQHVQLFLHPQAPPDQQDDAPVGNDVDGDDDDADPDDPADAAPKADLPQNVPPPPEPLPEPAIQQNHNPVAPTLLPGPALPSAT